MVELGSTLILVYTEERFIPLKLHEQEIYKNQERYFWELKMMIPDKHHVSMFQDSKKDMKLLNVYHDEQDGDQTFVPRTILEYRKRIIPRRIIKKLVEDNIKFSTVERGDYIRVRV